MPGPVLVGPVAAEVGGQVDDIDLPGGVGVGGVGALVVEERSDGGDRGGGLGGGLGGGRGGGGGGRGVGVAATGERQHEREGGSEQDEAVHPDDATAPGGARTRAGGRR